MIFKRKGREEVEPELLASVVAAIAYHTKRRKEEAKVGVGEVITEVKVGEERFITSSWISIWRYEIGTHTYRRGGVRGW